MSQTSAARAAPEAAETTAGSGVPPRPPIVLVTRFGEMEIDPDTTIRMPRGLMGFAALHEFALAALPEDRFAGFRVLQSVEDASVSFIVLPYEPALGAVAPEDLAEAFRALGIAEADGAVLLIVSVRRTGQEATASVNLRAPVVVDVKRRMGWQHVLANQAYPVRQDLSALSKG
jgi:flagellar assembly factor FliW